MADDLKSYFELLEIPVGSSQEEIKKAYRKKAKTLHPDKGGDSEVFKKINEAYTKLTEQPKNPFNIFIRLPPTVTTLDVHLEHLCLRYIVKFPFERTRACDCSSYITCTTCGGKGTVILNMGFISIQQPCRHCIGKGKIHGSCSNCSNGLRKDTKIFDLYLSPEFENGYKYHFQNEGNQDVHGNIADLVVVLKYKEHDNFKVVDKNLIHKIKISLKESLCGYKKEIKHPSGEVIQFQSSNVISHKSKTVINNKGLTEQGNLIIEHSVVFPETIDAETKEILSKLNF